MVDLTIDIMAYWLNIILFFELCIFRTSLFQVLSMDKFEHLGLLIYFGERGSERVPLSQNTPFFANSDPDMPAVPVTASQGLHWLIQNISSTLEHISDRVSTKENASSNSSDQDVMMTETGSSPSKPSGSSRGPSFIEGICKSSCVKQASDLKGTSVKVQSILLYDLLVIFYYVFSISNLKL